MEPLFLFYPPLKQSKEYISNIYPFERWTKGVSLIYFPKLYTNCSHPYAQQHLKLELEHVPPAYLLLHDIHEHDVFIFGRYQLELFLDHAAGTRFAGHDAITAADTVVQVDDRFTVNQSSNLKLTAPYTGAAARAYSNIDFRMVIAGVHIGGAG